MNINSENNDENSVVLVDYHNNKFLEKHGVACHWWKSEATSMHCHNFYEFFIVTSGNAIHEINGKQFKLHKGTIHLIRPEDMHKIIPSEKNGCIHINLSVVPEKLNEICRALSIPTQELINITTPEADLSVSETEYFTKYAERISLLYFNGDDRCRIMICELIVQAISIIYRKKIFSQFDCPEWFTDILEKIHSPRYCACTAEDIYKTAGFSPPVIIELFKKYTGKTVCEYIRGVKMNRACELLKNSDMPIIEISNLLGYASLSHFCRIFKDSTGITPSAYRKSDRKIMSDFG